MQMQINQLEPPPFSVLMSLYIQTDPEYLNEALSSIWNAQSLKPSQIVLVKDGPLTSQLNLIIGDWARLLSESFVIVELSKNLGLASALNQGLKYCEFELVARMDPDDIATPDRFKLQIEFMSLHPEVSVLSGAVEEWSDDMISLLSTRLLPLHHAELVRFARYRNPMSHPAVVFKKSAVLSVGGYSTKIFPEDYLLWGLLMSNGFLHANLPNVLVRMRTDESFSKRRGRVFLRGQLDAFNIFRKIGFFSWPQYFASSLVIIVVRLAPQSFRALLYKYARR
jgi:glycosyltransferase involved in cell wall biosynthesis